MYHFNTIQVASRPFFQIGTFVVFGLSTCFIVGKYLGCAMYVLSAVTCLGAIDILDTQLQHKRGFIFIWADDISSSIRKHLLTTRI